MSLSLGAPAVGLSAAAVREGERAGQSVRGYLETTKQGVFALAQASGGITFGVVPTHLGVIIPVHLGVNIHQDYNVSRRSFRQGNLRKAPLQDLQCLCGVTSLGRNSCADNQIHPLRAIS